MNETQIPADLPYEAARGELIEVVKTLEAGQEPLEDSLRLWERGEALAAHCQNVLDQAKLRMDQVQGEASTP